MSPVQEAFITTEVLKWARERSGESEAGVAQKINVKKEKFVAWEKGAARPTLRQAKNLAKKLNIPFGYLFLASPPEEPRVPLPDFRTVSVDSQSEASPEFWDLYGDVLFKQDWYRQHVIEEGARPLGFVGSFGIDDGVEDVSENIAEIIGINEKFREDSISWGGFLRRLILNTEDAGIVVMKSGIVGSNTQRPLSVVEFRGFAVVDPIAPLIFINSRDAISAQIFTLIHELAHIWIGAEGVSRPDWSKKASRQINEVEQFCNAVAAEVLVPSEKFEDLWESDKTDDDNLRDLSAYFHVSQFVTLRKAYDLNRVSTTTFLGKLELFQRQERPPKSEGGNFYATLKIRNSRKITEALVQGALSGHVLYLDAAKMLNIKIGTIEKVAKKLGEQ